MEVIRFDVPERQEMLQLTWRSDSHRINLSYMPKLCVWLIRHQHPRKALWGPIQVRFKHLPGYRLARWAAECAVRLTRCE